ALLAMALRGTGWIAHDRPAQRPDVPVARPWSCRRIAATTV
ncbi:MAG: hypothetical protein AVDCRST_MAG88-3600, partial [uncultured Thermomicrobiales bacterium]